MKRSWVSLCHLYILFVSFSVRYSLSQLFNSKLHPIVFTHSLLSCSLFFSFPVLSCPVLSFPFLFFFCTQSIRKFLGQGSNVSSSRDLHHNGGTTGSLTHCTGPGLKLTPLHGPEPLQLDLEPTAPHQELPTICFSSCRERWTPSCNVIVMKVPSGASSSIHWILDSKFKAIQIWS